MGTVRLVGRLMIQEVCRQPSTECSVRRSSRSEAHLWPVRAIGLLGPDLVALLPSRLYRTRTGWNCDHIQSLTRCIALSLKSTLLEAALRTGCPIQPTCQRKYAPRSSHG